MRSFSPVSGQFADLAEELGDLLALAQDLPVRGLERVLTVQSSPAPGGFQRLLFGSAAFGRRGRCGGKSGG